MMGDASLFARADEIELSWGIIDPVQAGWERQAAKPPRVGAVTSRRRWSSTSRAGGDRPAPNVCWHPPAGTGAWDATMAKADAPACILP